MELNKRVKYNFSGNFRILHIIRKEDSILASNNISGKKSNEKGGKDTDEMRLKVYLEEYKTLSDEILRRIDFQQQLLRYYLILGGLIAAIVNIVSSNFISSALNDMSLDFISLFLLLTPMIFISISLYFSRHDIMIISIATYINKNLRQKIKN